MGTYVYFHIDELGRDAVTASALKKEFKKSNITLIYGNRLYTKYLLEKFIWAFDLIILPRPMFLCGFKHIENKSPPIVILFTEAVGRVVHEDYDKFTLYSLLDKDFMEGDTRYVDKVSAFCFWGGSAKLRVDKYYPALSKKIYVVGHPRHDKLCLEQSTNSQNKGKPAIGLITRQPLLNDYNNRRPVNAIVEASICAEARYSYYNKKTGDYLKENEVETDVADEIYKEASDIQIMITLLEELEKRGYQVHLKVHPREDRKYWSSIINKKQLNVSLAHWCVPFAHWIKSLDYVIGPASTSFYDAYVAGVEPICTRNIDATRNYHVNQLCEENGALMQHVAHPGSIDELIEIIESGVKPHQILPEIEDVLKKETNFPESRKSISKVVATCRMYIVNNVKLSIRKHIYMVVFSAYSRALNIFMSIYRVIRGRKEQGSTFLLTRKNRIYIDSLVKEPGSGN